MRWGSTCSSEEFEASDLAAVEEFADAGFTSLHLHQIGPDQRGFLEWWHERLAPALAGVGD